MNGFDHRAGESLTVDGSDIYFELCGNPSGAPLLLLHGGMGNIEDWNELIPEIGNFRIVGIDARGHGKSTLGAAPLTYRRLQVDVCCVLDHLDMRKTSIVGFSDGGIAAYRLAVQDPDRVEKLISIGAPCRLTEATGKILRKVTPEGWKQKFPEMHAAYMKHNPEPRFDSFVAASVKMWLDTSASGYPADSVKNIRCPTLVMRGDDDHLYSLEEAVELRRCIEGAKLLNVPFAGHAAFTDQPKICALSARQFLES